MNLTFEPSIEKVVQAAFAPDNLVNIQQHEWEMREFMRQALTELRPQRTVELGTYKGWTSALLSHITEVATVTVDITDYGAQPALMEGKNLTQVIYDATNPDATVRVLPLLGGPIDLLFIDDGHYFAQIAKEAEIWTPHVRPGGWVVFHDINPKANIGPHGIQPEELQVTAFWNQLQGDKSEIIATEEHAEFKGVIPHGGIGILKI